MNFRRIIIIDDDDASLLVNKECVNEMFPNTEIIVYKDSEEFLNDALKSEAWFEEHTLALLDINMPGYFGYEVLEELEENIDHMENFSAIMVTSSTLKRDLERSTRFSCIIGYIDKPLSVEKLTLSLYPGIDTL
ncbi:MAG: response regulator [Flavobacteriales bacterium]